LVVLAGLLSARLLADGPGDNAYDKVRPIPPPGVALPTEIRQELTAETSRLESEIDAVRTQLAGKTNLLARLPDALIFHKSVDWALRYNEFFSTNEFKAARTQLEEGFKRLGSLRDGKTPWDAATGQVVRGYRSRIDGSIQPYGLVIPGSYSPQSGKRWRLDFWFHGRGETLSELSFLRDRMGGPGEFHPADTLVLHLYGRYCNGSRLAGETDFWEALADVKKNYPIDEDRLVVRGFSLGGAACWHFTTHYAAQWAAAAPGAGFSETEEFLRVFQGETLNPPLWERKLWRLYDSTSVALNTTMVPLIAYSGENDKQMQAAKAMEKAMADEGLTLTHLIGPKTGHSYEPVTKAELSRRIDAIATHGRDPLPREVRFVTHSLHYNTMAWVQLDGLQEHWEPARVEAAWQDENRVSAKTRNITALSFHMPPGLAPFAAGRDVQVVLDGQTILAPRPASERSWHASFHREGPSWRPGPATVNGLHKRHGLQGPIDDAFMDSFLVVLPSGTSLNEKVDAWVKSESTRAIAQWRSQFRGDAPQKVDKDVTDEDIRTRNLALWGDPNSNLLLAKIADKLPIRWTKDGIDVGKEHYGAADHVPVLVFPNPLNPEHYIVINSGATYREYDYLNNARQTPKLPDWAVLDINQPPNARYPGKIVAADFFNEDWALR
jgi:dienelactone hydrolase